MSDDLDYFSPEVPASDTPAPEVETPATPDYSAEIQQLKQQNQALMQWKEQTSRYFGGNQPSPQDQQRMELEQLQTRLINDTPGLFQDVKQQAVQEAVEQLRQEQLIESYRQKHPELQQHEAYVSIEVQGFIEEELAAGRRPTHAQAIEKGIERFNSKFGAGLQQHQQQQQAQHVKLQALNLSPAGSPPPNGAADPFAISDKDWPAYWAQKQRELYQT